MTDQYQEIYMPNYLCPFHDDTNASLSIRNGWYRCFGCGARGRVTDELLMMIDVEKQHKSSYVRVQDFGEIREEGIEFLKSRNINLDLAEEYGVKQRGKNELIYPLLDINTKKIGHQVRYIEGKTKYKTVPELGVYPQYANVYRNLHKGQVYLVESVIDALSIATRYRIGSYVCLGTEIRPDLLEVLSREDRDMYIWFDNDAVLNSYNLADKFRFLYDRKIHVMDVERKPYE